MVSIVDLFAVANLTYQLIQHIRHAPTRYQEAVKTLESLSRLLAQIISITKQFHELDSAQLQLTAPGGPGLPPIQRVIGKDWVIDLDSPVGNDIHEHISQCLLRLNEFRMATTKWQVLAPGPGENGLVVSVRRALTTRFMFSKRKMLAFEYAIQKHINALQTYISLASFGLQRSADEKITDISARLDRDGAKMFEKIEALTQVTMGIAPNMPSDNIRIFEPYGKLTNLHISLCSSLSDIFSTLSIALRGNGFPNLLPGSPGRTCNTLFRHPLQPSETSIHLTDWEDVPVCSSSLVSGHFLVISMHYANICFGISQLNKNMPVLHIRSLRVHELSPLLQNQHARLESLNLHPHPELQVENDVEVCVRWARWNMCPDLPISMGRTINYLGPQHSPIPIFDPRSTNCLPSMRLVAQNQFHAAIGPPPTPTGNGPSKYDSESSPNTKATIRQTALRKTFHRDLYYHVPIVQVQVQICTFKNEIIESHSSETVLLRSTTGGQQCHLSESWDAAVPGPLGRVPVKDYWSIYLRTES